MTTPPAACGPDTPRPGPWPRSSSPAVSLRHVGSTGTVSATSAPSDCKTPTSASVISPAITHSTYALALIRQAIGALRGAVRPRSARAAAL